MAGNISDQTTVLSNVSLTGRLSVSSLSIGGGNLSNVLVSTVTIVATTVTASSSVTTAATVVGVAVGDTLQITPLSALSQGVTLQGYVSAASTVIFTYSNVSTAAASEIATGVRVSALRF